MTSSPAESPRPCEDCGGRVIVGPEPVDPARRGTDASDATQLVDFCTNLGCSSNRLAGLQRVAVNRYVCTSCGAELSGPMSKIFGHRRTH